MKNINKTDQHIHLEGQIPESFAKKRLDQALAQLFPAHSRARIKEWIEKGAVLINGKNLEPKTKVFGGEWVVIDAYLPAAVEWTEEPIPIDIIFQDEHLLIINKPENLVVHPAVGNEHGTLVNALLHWVPSLKQLPRAGVIHRLDKDTTGLLVVAKTLECHTRLITQMQNREIHREYEALVWGVMVSGGTVDAPIARHPNDRKKMAVVPDGKPAVTHYRVIKRYSSYTHLQIQLETGRTHQIRVHMAHIHHPIVGDKTYGGRLRLPPNATAAQLEALRSFPRQALHARRLAFEHPMTNEPLSFEAPLPIDFQDLLAILV